MVAIARRLRVSRPLLNVRTGPGAVQLPRHPVPRLTRIVLEYPRFKPKADGESDNSLVAATKGAYHFNKEYLPRIKYHNPSLKIDVQNYPKSRPRLTLHFESTDRDALRAIESPRAKPGVVPTQSKIAAGKFIEERAVSGGDPLQDDQAHGEIRLKEQPSTTASPSGQPIQPATHAATNTARTIAPLYTTKLKKPINTSQSVKSSTPMYERIVYYSLQDKPVWEIFKWFQFRTGAVPQTSSAEDKRLKRELEGKAQRAAIQREHTAKIQAVRDREKAAIKEVREAAERNAAEAAAAAIPV